MQRIIAIILFLLVILCLHACVNVATTGAQAVYNRRNLEKSVNDQLTTMRVYQALNYKTTEFKNANISIATLNGEVLLAGQAPEDWQRTKAGQIVGEVRDVKKVYNLIEVASPSSTITRISDSWLTAKVKARLLASNDVDASEIKVVTENGTVYLMGILKPEDAEAATDIASQTGGVLSVVKIFSYIKISKTLS